MDAIDRDRESQIITRLRAIAVFLIVTAHCIAMPDNSGRIAKTMMEFIVSISYFGVWVFFVLGGALFAYERRSPTEICKRKLVSLILPWLTTGTLVYIWTYIRHGNISLYTYGLFLVGYGSYLWYMTVFVVLMVIYTFLRKTKYLIFLPIMYGIVIIFSGLLPKLAGNDYSLYYFLVGAWPVAFGLGFIITRFFLQSKLNAFVFRYGKWISIGFATMFIGVFIIMGQLHYWSVQYLPLCILSMPVFLWATINLEKWITPILDEIGKRSFSIYLLHMPIAGIVSNLFCRFDRGYSVAIRPFIVLIICFLMIRVTERVCNKMGWKWVKLAIGLR